MFNKPLKMFNSRESCAKHMCLVYLVLSIVLIGSCGKRKPPLPPIARVAQEVDIRGQQRGNQVTITWQMPARNAPTGNALNISRADVYRLAEPLNSSLSLTEEDFAATSTLIASIPIADTDFALKEKSYIDKLRFAGQPARLRYAIRFVNASGQKAAFSSFFLIEPTAKVATQPNNFTATVSQEAIILRWAAPTVNEDGSTPANILGYNLYRKESTEDTDKKRNDSPIKDPRFNDEFFKFDSSYTYFVRTVSLGADGRPIESSSSDAIAVEPKDTFAPSAPDAITIATAPNNISIFFATNIEKDIAGYRVYRTAAPNTPRSDWELLTKIPIKTTTFQDSRVQPGKTYYYYLTAFDTYGNVSAASIVVSETAL